MIGTITSIYDGESSFFSRNFGAKLRTSRLVGACLGAVASSFFGDKLGRRGTTSTGAIVLILGALLQATAYTRAQIIVARTVSGCGIGIANAAFAVYQAEFSPKANRGLCVSLSISALMN